MAIESTQAKSAYLKSLFEKSGGIENPEAQFFLLIHHYQRGALTQAELFNQLTNSWQNRNQSFFKGQIAFWYEDGERRHILDFGRTFNGGLYLNYPFCDDAVTTKMNLE